MRTIRTRLHAVPPAFACLPDLRLRIKGGRPERWQCHSLGRAAPGDRAGKPETGGLTIIGWTGAGTSSLPVAAVLRYGRQRV